MPADKILRKTSKGESSSLHETFLPIFEKIGFRFSTSTFTRLWLDLVYTRGGSTTLF